MKYRCKEQNQITRIGVFAQGQILCISPNGLQVGHYDAPDPILDDQKWPKTIGFFHYVLSMAMPNMKLIGEFITQSEMPQAFLQNGRQRPFYFSD